ncbi:NUDIX domain-containing protein [Marinicrinis lubricantis]|uniref:NUDIX domain-containing protein n=1 Tax=Marinicrinis lubricantis TaxID=2086470 RepID=A0ABW1IQW7_9BACL
MKLRHMAVAVIERDKRLLMMKRDGSRLFPFEFWSFVGGHLEPNELNDPRGACIREIYEESGLEESDLIDFRLRYVLLRQKEDEIRIQYVFFGRTRRFEVVASDEGNLYWMNKTQVQQLNLSTIIRGMLEHHMEHEHEERVMVGTIRKHPDGEKPRIQWSLMDDPLRF